MSLNIPKPHPSTLIERLRYAGRLGCVVYATFNIFTQTTPKRLWKLSNLVGSNLWLGRQGCLMNARGKKTYVTNKDLIVRELVVDKTFSGHTVCVCVYECEDYDETCDRFRPSYSNEQTNFLFFYQLPLGHGCYGNKQPTNMWHNLHLEVCPS